MGPIAGPQRPLIDVLYRIALALTLLLAFHPALAEDAVPFDQQVEEWRAVITEIEETVSDPALRDSDLQSLRQRMQALLAEFKTFSEEAKPRLEAVQEQLDGLGPPPAEGELAESEQVAALRAEKVDAISELQGMIQQLDLLTVRSEQVLTTISAVRLQHFTSRILQRGTSPLNPALWEDAITDRVDVWEIVQRQVGIWWQFAILKLHQEAYVVIGVAILFTFLVNFPLRSRLLRFYGQSFTEIDPSYIERCAAAIWVAAVRSILPMVTIGIVYMTLRGYGLLDDRIFPEIVELIDTLVLSSILLIVISTLSGAILAPRKPAWRLFPMPDASARRMTWLLIAVAVVFFLNSVSGEALELGRATVSVITQKQFMASTLIAILLLLALMTRLYAPAAATSEAITEAVPAASPGEQPETDQPPPSRFPYLRLALGAVVLAIPIIGMLGFVPLARLLTEQLVITGSIIAAAYLLYMISSELFSQGLAGDTNVSRGIRKALSLSSEALDLLAFWLSTLVTTLLVIAGVILIMLAWGIEASEIGTWASAAFFGFRVGDFTISIYGILVAIGLFIGVLVIFRLFQNWLDRRVLPRTKIDAGVRNSIKTGIGYIGLIIAAIIAFSFIGLDLSNLAIVAGALSVGIGFGLQSIVNNFVSGLILLAERPIKVGDWIVVGAEQGYVKRISVRATEVETFDRSSVIIPNSALISDQVKNWTHKDKLGRIIVGVGVAYGTDVEKVREILLRIARETPGVAHYPVPFIYFKDFGASSLDFELRCFLRDIDNALSTSSNIRFAIVKAFAEAGIAIPFPQRDLHIVSQPAAPATPIEIRPQSAASATEDPATRRAGAADAKPGGGIDAAPAGTISGDSDGDAGSGR